jgi:hypothetical protein
MAEARQEAQQQGQRASQKEQQRDQWRQMASNGLKKVIFYEKARERTPDGSLDRGRF